jgi:hypothetical protein
VPLIREEIETAHVDSAELPWVPFAPLSDEFHLAAPARFRRGTAAGHPLESAAQGA